MSICMGSREGSIVLARGSVPSVIPFQYRGGLPSTLAIRSNVLLNRERCIMLCPLLLPITMPNRRLLSLLVHPMPTSQNPAANRTDDPAAGS